MPQIPLPFPIEPHARFETYVPGANEPLLAHLKSLAAGERKAEALWVWGGESAGKSHLLQAACANAPLGRAIYLPLNSVVDRNPEIIDGLESLDLVVLDDVDAVAGEPAWDQALFGLFNGIQAAAGRLLMAARLPPAGVSFSLPDMASRAGGALVYQVRSLEDEESIVALQTRAKFRGFELPEASARFLIRRLPRDMSRLCHWLDALDQASLAAHRRLTIPFIRETLAEQA